MGLRCLSLLIAVLLLPSTVSCVVHRQSAAQLEEEEEGITGLRIVEESGGKVDCVSLGAPWSLAGPSLMMSPLVERSTSRNTTRRGLCVQRDREAAAVVTDIGFVVVQDSTERAPSFLSRPHALLNLSRRVVFAQRAEDQCAQLGKSWTLVAGRILPVASGAVHLCMLSVAREHADFSEVLMSVAPYALGTASKTPCSKVRSDAGSTRRLQVPGMEIEDLYDNPLLLCVVRRHQASSVPDSTVAATALFLKMAGGVEQPGPEMFPKEEFEVSVDVGNRSRNHIFVVGPETSGTRLWSELVRNAYGLQGKEWVYNSHAAVFHLSLPWGSVCGSTVPNYLDFGGNEGAYKYAGLGSLPVTTSAHAARFNVQPLNIVQQHRSRGDQVKVLLVVRDPRASFAGKMGQHCFNEEFGVPEQKEAFAVMLNASRANDPDVHVICYEDMLSGGEGYVRDKFVEMGMTPGDIPTIRDGNSKYSLDDLDCEGDMLSYRELCPNTELGQEIESKCRED
mmetsp:Transcript_41235/g.94866  ORF Transcript_41235/g.94866 Transcript_41235/m.94866 type:complete len:507 (-) Transcript_41235:94-1614(-)